MVKAALATEPKRLTGPKAERTRAQIEAAVMDLLRSKPLGEIMLDDICRGAKITQGALYFHFRNKDDAIEATALKYVQEFYRRLLLLNGEELYEALFPIIREFFPHSSWRKLMRSLQVIVRSKPTLFQIWMVERGALVKHLVDIAGRAQRAAGMPTDDTLKMVEFLLAGVETAFEHLLDVDAPTGDEPEAEIRLVTLVWHRALLGRDPSPAVIARMTDAHMERVRANAKRRGRGARSPVRVVSA